MLRRFSQSLVTRLMAVAIVLLTIGTIGRAVILTDYVRGGITALVEAEQASIATYVARDIDNRVSERLALLRRLASHLPPALLTQPDRLRAWLAERQALYPLFSDGLLVVPTTGEAAMADAPGRPGADRAFGDMDWFLDARDHGRAAIGRPYRNPTSGEPEIVMAVPVGTAGAPPAAVLAGVTALGVPSFLGAIPTTRIGETGGLVLISPRDRLVVSSGGDPATILRSTPPTGANPLLDRAMTGFRGTEIAANTSGVEELVAIASVDSAGWFVVAHLPTAEAFAPATRMRAFGLRNTVWMGALVLGGLLYILPRILKPLRDAAREMRRMAEGETDLKPLPVIREDEVGTLVLGFNSLLNQVRQREAELRDREALMTRRAHHDPLTGLPNRAMFHQCLQQEIAFNTLVDNSFALMFLDLDGFKPVNDSYGHAAGDEVLRQVAARLKLAVRPLDIVARLGGDEFVIMMLTGVEAPRTSAQTVANRCLDAIGQPFSVAGAEIRIGLSIGIAICPDDGREASWLMRHADAALYHGKKIGRGRVVFYQDEYG